jgi:hypothetical protein
LDRPESSIGLTLKVFLWDPAVVQVQTVTHPV